MPVWLKGMPTGIWNLRTKLLVLLLVISLLAPQPSRGQLLIDIGVIVAAINSIGTAINNVIGRGLRVINSALSTLNDIMNEINRFFQEVVYPLDAINRARGLVGAVQGIYSQIRAIANLPVASATLPNPRRLERTLLSRDPASIGQVTSDFRRVYQDIPVSQDAAPATRDVIDITDAAAQAAMKRAIAIEAIAEEELRAAGRLSSELAAAAPGTAPMIEAQAAAWLVRAHAYTQSAMAELMRIRAIQVANYGASLKENAQRAGQTRQQVIDAFQR